MEMWDYPSSWVRRGWELNESRKKRNRSTQGEPPQDKQQQPDPILLDNGCIKDRIAAHGIKPGKK